MIEEYMTTYKDDDMERQVRRAKSEGFLAEALRKAREYEEDQRLRVEAAKEDNPDKERFDIQKLAAVYNIGSDSPSKKEVDDLEARYYLDLTEPQTIDEFASRMTWLDRNESN